MPANDSSEFHGSSQTRSVADWLRVLRDDHPAAEVTTELVRLEPNLVVMRAEIAITEGGRASGYGAIAAGDPAAIEGAESRSLQRALAAMGYGEAQEAAPRPAAAPAERGPARPAEPVVDVPAREPAPTPPVASDRPEPGRSPAPEPRAAAVPVVEVDPPLEDYSWTSFWNWARGIGYQNKAAVEQALQQSITSLNPSQVRDLLRAKADVD